MLGLCDRELEEALAHLTELGRVSRRQEPVAPLTALGVYDPLADERLRDLSRRLLRGEDERDGSPEHALEDRLHERIVRTAEDHGVDVGLLEPSGVLADSGGRLRPEGIVAFDQRNEARAGDGHDLRSGVEGAHELRIPAACNRGLGREQADAPVPGSEHRGMRLGCENADDRDTKTTLEVRQGGGRGRVAGGHDQLHAQPFEIAGDLSRKAADLIEWPGTVRKPCAVSEVDEVLVGKRDEALVQNGEPSHPRVENPYRARIHARDCMSGTGSVPPSSTLAAVVKAWSAVLAAALVLVVGDAVGATLAREDVLIAMDDGVSIAATVYRPDGEAPAGGWPALVFLHGLSGNRTQMNALVEAYGFAGGPYVILTFDARGHGDSGGLVSIDGPREIADTRSVHDWLASRPDVADTKVGAWGISYGGGAVFNSLVAGVPWAAVVTVETWTDLYSALAPQGLVKSGLVAGLAGSIPEAKRDPSLIAVQAAAFAGNTAAVRPWAAARSSLDRLGSVTTPVFMAQGRRDFLFGIDQGSRAFGLLRGPKRLYIGLHGHAPSSFPAADTSSLMTQVRAWFDCYLRSSGCDPDSTAVFLAAERPAGRIARAHTLPLPTSATRITLPGQSSFVRGGKAIRRIRPLAKPLEVFGSPVVRTTIVGSGGWSRLVAVLTARTPQGKEIVVSAGGVPTTNGPKQVTIRMIDQATFVPKGSRLTLTLGSSSLAQSASNLLYLDLPMPAGARVRVGNTLLTIPALRTPITK